jgi:predicted PurR-regulated permease PerM
VENDSRDTNYDPQFVRNMIEAFLRIGLLLLLLVTTYDIIRPFTIPILWGALIAIATFPLVTWLEPKLGGRRGLAVSLITLVFITLLSLPMWRVTEALLGGVNSIYHSLEAGTLEIPPPDENVAQWPFIGEKVYVSWSAASEDFDAFIDARADRISELTRTSLKRLGSGLLEVATLIASFAIASAFMIYAERCSRAAQLFFIRVGGRKQGSEWGPLIVSTVRSVLQGVIGVALVQTALITAGMVIADIPGTPIWTVVILVLSVAQLPTIIVVAPMMLYLFSTGDTTTAVVFTIYQIIVGTSDYLLRPLLMGRSVDIPMPIILVGSIGGMLTSGIVGLFTGAVILSLAYKLFALWVEDEAADSTGGSPDPES